MRTTNFSANLADSNYLNAALSILSEMESRGFSTDDPEKSEGFLLKMVEIIKTSIEGNVSISDDSDEIDRIFTEMEIKELDDPSFYGERVLDVDRL